MKTNKKLFAYFNHKEIELPLDCVLDCSAQGRVDDSVEFWQRQIELNLSRKNLIDGLAETGGWDRDELNSFDDDELEQKALWVMACDIRDEMNNEIENEGK